MKFAHLGDCHLGSWRVPALQQLNLESFRKAVDICIKEDVDFVLIAGDLFDSAYPPIEILKDTFYEFKRMKDAAIPCFLIAGSHDFSASGKTFLDVLEKAGFCKNVFRSEERNGQTFLFPEIYENAAIYGYPGKKAGMEVAEIRNLKLHESPGFFNIFMLHTSIKGAVGSLPIDSLIEEELPKADYYALGHLHIDYAEGNFVYSGPIFPNNFQELEELKGGSFYIVEFENSRMKYARIPLLIKDVEVVDMEIKNAFTAAELIKVELDRRTIKDKVVLLKLSGELEKGKTSNINFKDIEDYLKSKECFAFLRSTSQLSVKDLEEVKLEISDMDKIEETIILKSSQEKSSEFSKLILPLMNSLAMEKQEDEKSTIFSERLLSEFRKIAGLT